jgi:hypothetical protein
MGWVEAYEYDLGFCIFSTLVQANPNDKDYDNKYTMGRIG